MITGYKNAKTRKVHQTGKPKGFSGLDGALAADTLNLVKAAPSLDVLKAFQRLRLHKLTGDRAGQWALSVNGPWRICFEVAERGFDNVEFTDYHKG